MHIVFAGGGTAGHINPALAVAGYIMERHPDAKISYIGKKGGMEERLVAAYGYDFYGINVAGFQRQINPENILKNIGAVYKVFKSSHTAAGLLKSLNPDVVVGTGGYVSGPVLRSAAKLNFKTVIHEQNAYPGITTKMLANRVNSVLLAMPEAEKYLKCKSKPVITGNPVRGELIKRSKAEARQKLGFGDKPVVFSFGGSLGAEAVNDAVVELIASKWKDNNIIFMHATGSSGYDDMMQKLKQHKVDVNAANVIINEYTDNTLCIPAADLIISRAGAITLSEVGVCGKPSILIPSPFVAENHQYHNALALKKIGAAELIEEKNLTGSLLAKTVDELIFNSSKLMRMAEKAKTSAISDANRRMYNEIMKLYTVH